MFVNLHIADVSANALLDTGSTCSVLHPSKYYAIPEDIRPQLHEADDLEMGDGSHVQPHESAIFTLQLGSGVRVEQTMVIAEIQVPAVLGYDFMFSHKGVVDICGQALVLDKKHVIPCRLESSLPSLFRITVAETISIPPRSETIVKAHIVNTSNSNNMSPICIETKPSFSDPCQDAMPLRLMNTTNETNLTYIHPFSNTLDISHNY